MLQLTLDHNCIIALENNEPSARHLRTVISGHRQQAIIAITEMAASERRKDGRYETSFEKFEERIQILGLDHLKRLQPMGFSDICFWDHCVYCGDKDIKLHQNIWQTLFPNVETEWIDFARRNLADPSDKSSKAYRLWRNRLCDVQALWSHIANEGDVFVTLNTNDFMANSKLERLISLGAKKILTPEDAAALF